MSSIFCSSVCKFFTYFYLLLQNHWDNFIQTWHKASMDERDPSLFKWMTTSFHRGYNNDFVIFHKGSLKIIFSRSNGSISTNLAQRILGWMEFNFVHSKGQKEINQEIKEIILSLNQHNCIIIALFRCVYWLKLFLRWAICPRASCYMCGRVTNLPVFLLTYEQMKPMNGYTIHM